jgi:hypothetical protein
MNPRTPHLNLDGASQLALACALITTLRAAHAAQLLAEHEPQLANAANFARRAQLARATNVGVALRSQLSETAYERLYNRCLLIAVRSVGMDPSDN